MDVRIQNDLLIARTRGRIPKVCLKCGTTENVSRRDQAFAVGRHGAQLGMFGGVAGACAAAVVRNVFRDDTTMQAAAIAVIVIAVAILALAIDRNTQRVHLALPLCAPCNVHWDEGLAARTAMLVGIGIAGALALVGLAVESGVFLGIAGLIFVAVIGYAAVIRIPARVIASPWATLDTRGAHGEVALRIDPAIAQKVVARAEKRAKRDAEKADDAA